MRTCARCGLDRGRGKTFCHPCSVIHDREKRLEVCKAKRKRELKPNFQAMILGYFKETRYDTAPSLRGYGTNADGVLV